MKAKLSHIFLVSLLYSMVLFTIIRVINDSLMKEFYWNANRINFICADVITLPIVAFLFFIVIYKLLDYFQKRKSSIVIQYSTLALLATLSVMVDGGITRSLLNLPIEFEDIPIAVISSILVSSLFYGYLRSQIIKKEVEKQNMLLQKIQNDQLQTELKLLKAQYHPHFLFNVLNTVYFQIDKTNLTPRHTIELLSDLLRYQLYNDGEKVLAGTEIDYLEKYISLCRMRSKDRLKLNCDFDEKLNEKKIYPLLFTPLIENAFKFVGGKYEIEISMKLLPDNYLFFEIINTIPDKEMPQKKGASGIGIENLKRRLELLYHDSHKLEITKDSEYFIARLTIKV